MGAEAVLKKVEEKKLLSQVASLGLLSKAEEAGFTPADLEPLLVAGTRFVCVVADVRLSVCMCVCMCVYAYACMNACVLLRAHVFV